MPQICFLLWQLTVTTPHNACIPQKNFDRKVGLKGSSAAIGVASSHMISPILVDLELIYQIPSSCRRHCLSHGGGPQ
ncbi:hypothetical protein BDV41DRAFT_530343 [Aspergillus transmontanensis]|uniref:GHMP kinase N-terminal domain-containing protein n=1 Tax=Aspergillus transmontanensis TaxID=1034304 RepID=A0A5N6W3Y9_9EURO|nr:hypothetical protein BDV41DRAFT_530343 [Aspergillus transmontanensis]